MPTNFPKPTSPSPALFEHNEVVPFMYEMDHIFHGLCTVTKQSKLHGTDIEKDFVEALL
ncbi:hypothetical protein BX070DRAFT_227717 [Coemansia spiralis]|nr:hypothetical protein BX070DRAFT_227680 [Coemansia spiralis]KAI9501987.1 hypothetical protein BX070DRAFT_227717 [Coemansia spiralis]